MASFLMALGCLAFDAYAQSGSPLAGFTLVNIEGVAPANAPTIGKQVIDGPHIEVRGLRGKEPQQYIELRGLTWTQGAIATATAWFCNDQSGLDCKPMPMFRTGVRTTEKVYLNAKWGDNTAKPTVPATLYVLFAGEKLRNAKVKSLRIVPPSIAQLGAAYSLHRDFRPELILTQEDGTSKTVVVAHDWYRLQMPSGVPAVDEAKQNWLVLRIVCDVGCNPPRTAASAGKEEDSPKPLELQLHVAGTGQPTEKRAPDAPEVLKEVEKLLEQHVLFLTKDGTTPITKTDWLKERPMVISVDGKGLATYAVRLSIPRDVASVAVGGSKLWCLEDCPAFPLQVSLSGEAAPPPAPPPADRPVKVLLRLSASQAPHVTNEELVTWLKSQAVKVRFKPGAWPSTTDERLVASTAAEAAVSLGGVLLPFTLPPGRVVDTIMLGTIPISLTEVDKETHQFLADLAGAAPLTPSVDVRISPRTRLYGREVEASGDDYRECQARLTLSAPRLGVPDAMDLVFGTDGLFALSDSKRLTHVRKDAVLKDYGAVRFTLVAPQPLKPCRAYASGAAQSGAPIRLSFAGNRLEGAVVHAPSRPWMLALIDQTKALDNSPRFTSKSDYAVAIEEAWKAAQNGIARFYGSASNSGRLATIDLGVLNRALATGRVPGFHELEGGLRDSVKPSRLRQFDSNQFTAWELFGRSTGQGWGSVEDGYRQVIREYHRLHLADPIPTANNAWPEGGSNFIVIFHLGDTQTNVCRVLAQTVTALGSAKYRALIVGVVADDLEVDSRGGKYRVGNCQDRKNYVNDPKAASPLIVSLSELQSRDAFNEFEADIENRLRHFVGVAN